MPIMEISVVPLGTKTPSVSRHVASCVGILRRKKGIRYVLTAMSTIVEAKRCSTLVRLVEQMHSSVFEHGVQHMT
ncbi:MAG: MTH1187 family thiamine-binding protein [Chitinispirillaceae bacterium]|nr:MTH1187 family thiamine-binding protein [Chitinispirillaceae bacterium]